MAAILKRLELPPVWLLACMALAWLLSRAAPLVSFDGPTAQWSGRGLILIGLLLMLWAALQFLRVRTSIIPREDARALITAGPFRFSRNPIYLADLLILLGWCLTLGALSGFLTAPLFVWAVNRRFIHGEEAMLRQAFPDAFAAWSAEVRRWL